MITRRHLFIAFSALTTVAIFGYLFQYVTISDVVDIIRNMNRAALAGFVGLSLTMSVFRAWRFAVLLNLSGYRPGRLALFLVVIVRNFFSDLLPARLGTLVYVYLVTNRLGVPFGAAASSFAVSFLFDMLALAPILVVAAILASGFDVVSPGLLTAGSVVLFAAAAAVMACLPALARLTAGLVSRVAPRRVRSTWSSAIASAGEELERVRRGGIYTKIFVLSMMVRLCKYGSLYVLLYALLQPLGYTFADLPPPEMIFGLVAPELAASLPISGIGGFGVYEGTWALVFTLLDFPRELASLTAVSHHLFTQVYGAVLGALALLALVIPLRATASIATERRPAPGHKKTGA